MLEHLPWEGRELFCVTFTVFVSRAIPEAPSLFLGHLVHEEPTNIQWAYLVCIISVWQKKQDKQHHALGDWSWKWAERNTKYLNKSLTHDYQSTRTGILIVCLLKIFPFSAQGCHLPQWKEIFSWSNSQRKCWGLVLIPYAKIPHFFYTLNRFPTYRNTHSKLQIFNLKSSIYLYSFYISKRRNCNYWVKQGIM